MSDVRLKRNFHPAGDQHWTRQPGVARAPWAKLGEETIAALVIRYQAGETPTELSRRYRIARRTVYRYLRRASAFGE